MSRLPNVNKVLISGYLIKDVQYENTKANNTLVANFRIVNERRFKNSSGDVKKEACMTNVIAWAKLAEICKNRQLQKGDYVFVDGILQTKKWGPDDDKKQINEIMAKTIQIVPNDNNGQQQDQQQEESYVEDGDQQ